jgi:hypothetical protein
LCASFGRRGEKGRGGGNVGAEGWRRISQEKDPGLKRRVEIRVSSAALRERERRIQEETILDSKQGGAEAGEKEVAADLRGRGGKEQSSLSPSTPLMAGPRCQALLPSGFGPRRHDVGSRVLDRTRGRSARTSGRGLTERRSAPECVSRTEWVSKKLKLKHGCCGY